MYGETNHVGAIHEGVALLPSLVAAMKDQPNHIIYIGNTSENHDQAMLKYAERFPHQDWMAAMGYSRERIVAMNKSINTMSCYFKSEAEKYGFPYYEIQDDDFEGSIENIIGQLVKR